MIELIPPRIWDEDFGTDSALFIGGGITGCPNWQSDFLDKIKNLNILCLNPRRQDFDVTNPNMEIEQIEWEFQHLQAANAIVFWFPEETLCPIVLYELGFWINTTKPLIVGCHPNYKRKRDIEIQTRLVRPELRISSSIDELSQETNHWYNCFELYNKIEKEFPRQ